MVVVRKDVVGAVFMSERDAENFLVGERAPMGFLVGEGSREKGTLKERFAGIVERRGRSGWCDGEGEEMKERDREEYVWESIMG